MGAREELVDFATDLHDCYIDGGSAYIAERVDQYLKKYRHELAEVLRDEIGRPDYENEGELVKRYVAGWRAAASALDPEA